jgi:hypothetical protein
MEMEELKVLLLMDRMVETEHPVWGGKVITDLSVAFNFTESAKIVIRANNILIFIQILIMDQLLQLDRD